MRLVVLGAPRPLNRNRWKDDLCEAAQGLGWSVLHLEAAGVPTEDVVRACRSADCLLWARTHGANPDGDANVMLRRIEAAGAATVGLHLDLYWGIARREPLIGVDPWWTCQWVFTADGGPRPWLQRGVNHRWCPPPLGPRWLGRGRPDARWLCQAVFVGRHIRRIHGPHRRALIDWAMRRWGSGFLQFGGGRWPQAWGTELADVYASARVAVGDSAPADAYWSDRVPATLGRGGLLAHPYVPGMAEQGFDDEVMVTFPRGRFSVLAAKLDGLSEAERQRRTDNALDLIRTRHLWSHRLQHIAEVVFGASADRVRRPSEEVGQPSGAAVASGAVG